MFCLDICKSEATLSKVTLASFNFSKIIKTVSFESVSLGLEKVSFS